MERKKKIVKYRVFTSSSEKLCKKCGFATFCLTVLYKHKLKCKGELLKSLVCCHCKRKFSYHLLYKQHKRNCVKLYQKFSDALKDKILKDSKKLHIYERTLKHRKSKANSFYDKHVKKESSSQRSSKKQDFSARKSFSKPKRQKMTLSDFSDISSIDPSNSLNTPKGNLIDSVSGCVCLWCKNYYPSKVLLMKHLEKNNKCAKAHADLCIYSPKDSYSARKSFGSTQNLVARKSFSGPRFNSSYVEGSARKSFSYSPSRKIQASLIKNSVKTENQCPICLEAFSDSFDLLQHQREFNHWGKATKSMSSTCKCPFCSKQFYHLRARNAHVRNHDDKSKDEIDLFLRNTTCQVCSQIFVSETAKYQHMKVEHSSAILNKISSGKRKKPSARSNFPPIIKQMLEDWPMHCPVCSKYFSTEYYRDKHFYRVHLDSEIECSFCTRRFHIINKLEYHLHSVHYDEFEFECLVCDVRIATAPLALMHAKEVHSGKSINGIIQSRGSKRVKLKDVGRVKPVEETKMKHPDYFCDVCNTYFQKLCGLQSHKMSRAHRDAQAKKENAPQEAAVGPPPQKKTLTCSECQEEFSGVKDFVPHRLGHFGVQSKYLKIGEDNLYSCEICGDVSNSHSKVQMHLFWHLQVESTAPSSLADDPPAKSKAAGATGPSPAVKSGDQLVAKKSFAKGAPADSQQKVVIGGVVKSLFTCEFCNVGFTTQSHYGLHVRKFCRAKSEAKADGDAPTLPGIDSLAKSMKRHDSLEHCADCGCLVSSPVGDIHSSICGETAGEAGSHGDVDALRARVRAEDGVAACVGCGEVFGDGDSYSEHMLGRHKKAKGGSSFLCTSCNCLIFSSAVLEDHKAFCSNTSYCDFDSESVEDILRAAQKLQNPVAACITCSLMFENGRCMGEHMATHRSSGAKESAPTENHSAEPKGAEVGDAPSLPDAAPGDDPPKLGNGECKSGDDLSEDNHPQDAGGGDPIATLRENFSQLLCILINDADLMEQLGYGRQSVDEVLVNVLQQMGQTPVLKDDRTLEIECLRKNIQILLDVCLKDQIMELIGEGQASTDDIVVEALKMFNSEDLQAVAVADG